MQLRTEKVGQCFFASVSLFTLFMVTIKIFIYLFIILSPIYSTQFFLILNTTCPTFFCPRL
jgi:hypothetical protein